jgi:hypothetical protein
MKNTEKRFTKWCTENSLYRVVNETNCETYLCQELSNNRTLHVTFSKGYYLARLRGNIKISVRYRDYNFKNRKDDWVYKTYFDNDSYEELLKFDINSIFNFKEITKEELIESQKGKRL